MVAAKIIFGAGTLDAKYVANDGVAKRLLDISHENGIDKIDTAYVYGGSEEILGRLDAKSRFAIDTKLPGAVSSDELLSKRDGVIKLGKESLARLQTDHVDVYYIHAPDRRIPFEDTLAGINELYKAGAFRRFGLSNFLPADVEEVIRICKINDWVIPTVYQGSYNAVQQTMKDELLPVLRKFGISYFAYSPSGGGFLAKKPEQLQGGAGEGRWDPKDFVGELYHRLYVNNERTMSALGKWNELAASQGVPGIELAYRWVVHNSVLDGTLGDAVIVGVRTEQQLRDTLSAINKGPLTEDVVKNTEEIWESIKGGSFLDNINGGGTGDLVKEASKGYE